jgi:hypothetical protein
MKRKVFLAVALVALMAVGAFAQTESDFEVTKKGNAITITVYNGSATVVTIPSRIQNLPVTTIGDSSFMSMPHITSVTIPSGVTSIGRFAFRNSPKLASVTIPNSVTSIGDSAFQSCTGLASVTFQGTIPASGIHANAFAGIGDLRDKFLSGGAGTYTKSGTTWTKQGGVSQTPASQYAPESDFQVSKGGNSISIDKYVGKGGAINIPPTIQGLPIAQLADRAFENNTAITAVTIPPRVAVNNRTFAGCTNLVSVTFLGGDPLNAPMHSAFPGGDDLREKYQAGGAGTYTRQANGTTWTKK